MVICQKDISALESAGVRTQPPPRSNRGYQYNLYGGGSTANSTNDQSTTSSRSCLVLPQFGKRSKRKSGGKRVVPNSAASTADQSSQADPFSVPTYNDTKSLLSHGSTKHNNNDSWFFESNFSANDPQQQFEYSMVTPSPSSTATPVTPASPATPASLLSFPEAKDRSHHARRKQNWSAYQGELEPEGVRGQEAKIVSPSTHSGSSHQNSNDLFPVRSFQSNQGLKSSSNLVISPSVQSSNTQATQARSFEASNSRQAPMVTSQTPVFSSHIPNQPSSSSSTGRRRRAQKPVQSNLNQSIDSDSSSDTTTHLEIFENNVAEIVQQDVDNFFNHPPSPKRSPEKISSKPVQKLKPDSNNRSSRETPEKRKSDKTKVSVSEIPNFRKSAPVNVDDSSFESPKANVEGIHAMAMEHVLRGEFDMALQAFSQVLQVYLEQHGRAHPLTASAYHNLGTVHSKRAGLLLDNTLHQRHCREQALLCFQAAARSARDAPQLGPHHPNVAVSLVRIGFLLLQSRQYQNAVITFQEALRIRSQHYGPTHALVANLYNNLGVCHMHLQEFPTGRRYLQQALDIQKQLLAQDEFSTTALLELADTLCNIGGLCLEWIRQQGPDSRHALDAESAFLEALEVRTKVLGENHALTNQVRSLHDMVRSIPLVRMSPASTPKRESVAGRRTASPCRSPKRASNLGSFSPTRSQGSQGRPYATGSPSRRHQENIPPQESNPLHHTPENLDMPPLKNSDAFDPFPYNYDTNDGKNVPSSPFKNSFIEGSSMQSSPNTTIKAVPPVDRSVQSELGSTFSSLDERMYEMTEENCLLSNFADGGETNETKLQVSSVVSYAQTTASWSGNYQSTPKDADRAACLMQAKNILNAHKDFMDSPQVTLGNKNKSRISQQGAGKDLNTSNTGSIGQNDAPLPNDDGLAPLGGSWPAATYDHISPEVLENPDQHLQTIHQCASDYMKRNRFNEAVHLLEIVLDCQRAKNGPLHEDVGAALHNVGIVYLRLDDHYKAIQAFEEAVRVRKGALGRDHPQVAVSLVKVGISLLLLKRYEDALWIFRDALSVRKHALGALHPSTARIYNNIGCVHVEFNELKEARRAFEAALDIQRSALVHDPDSGPIGFGAATTLVNLGYLYRRREMHEKAAIVLREALAIHEKILGSLHPTTLSTLESLAETCAVSNHGPLALKYYNEILERLHDRGGGSKLEEATLLYKMSKIHKYAKDEDSQLTKLQLAVKALKLDTANSEGRKALESQMEADINEVLMELERQEQ